MKDRVSLYPGRVKLTPVSGQENTYDMVRADEPTQEGTPLNKATLLKDATAALFGLDTSAVPDDVLAKLSDLYQHWWRRRTVTSSYILGDSKSYCIASTGSVRVTYYYADEIMMDPNTGKLNLKEPISEIYASNDEPSITQLEVCRGKFFKAASTAASGTLEIHYYPTDAPKGEYKSYNGKGYSYIYVKPVTGNLSFGTEWEYIHSMTDDAYPKSGIQDGYEYNYLGVPQNNALNGAKMQCISYLGTGTYGAENPNTITFDSKPKIVLFYKYGESNTMPYVWGATGFYIEAGATTANVATVTDNTITWYNSASASNQYNEASVKYECIGIG